MADNLLIPVWQGGGSAKWGSQAAAHLMRRAGFGGTSDEIEALVKLGPEKAVWSVVNYGSVRDDLTGVEFGEITAPGMGIAGPAARAGAAARAGGAGLRGR